MSTTKKSFFSAQAMTDYRIKDSDGKMLPGWFGYGTSKLLNIVHAKELARRLKGNDHVLQFVLQ